MAYSTKEFWKLIYDEKIECEIDIEELDFIIKLLIQINKEIIRKLCNNDVENNIKNEQELEDIARKK